MKKSFVCKTCNTEFERDVFPSNINKKTFEFCSASCRNKSRTLKEVECPVCLKLFKPVMYETRKIYCSKECSNYASRGRKSYNPKTHSKYDREFVKENYPKYGAAWVAEKLGYTKSAIANLAYKLNIILNKDIYYEKVHKSAKEYMSSDKNPNWGGGITNEQWGSNWKEQRKKALKRDGYTCQVCWLISGDNHVHHIQPRKYFTGHIEDANVLSNLITLCSSDHKLVECGKIKCPTPIH